MAWRWLELNQFHGSCDAYARERMSSSGRTPIGRTARHFPRSWSRALFCERRWEKRARRIKASFVTTKDVSTGTSGRKQLDDLSSRHRARANDFIDIFFYGNVTDHGEIRGRWYGRVRKASFLPVLIDRIFLQIIRIRHITYFAYNFQNASKDQQYAKVINSPGN